MLNTKFVILAEWMVMEDSVGSHATIVLGFENQISEFPFKGGAVPVRQ